MTGPIGIVSRIASTIRARATLSGPPETATTNSRPSSGKDRNRSATSPNRRGVLSMIPSKATQLVELGPDIGCPHERLADEHRLHSRRVEALDVGPRADPTFADETNVGRKARNQVERVLQPGDKRAQI